MVLIAFPDGSMLKWGERGEDGRKRKRKMYKKQQGGYTSVVRKGKKDSCNSALKVSKPFVNVTF